jgi:CRISPR/Cas system-associated exonuclease Cas4 (RecB family)
LEKYKTIETTKTFRLIFRQLASQQRIPFYGEPLQGLQVMGMLETRTLDFDTLVILSMNEGILPASNTSSTFIPFDIKKQFGLPTYKDNNAVFAYHFYRLIQRAKKIHLLYNTEAGDLGGEEKSRFIFQLLNELKRYNPRINIKEDLLSVPASKIQRDSSISIPKDENVMKLLKEEAQKGFHPSSLALYINCPLQFYLSRLIRLEESEEPEDTIDNRILGIVIHESLKNLLEPYIGKSLTKDGLSLMLQQVSAEIKKQFLLAGAGADITSGKNHLIADVAEKMLRQMIRKEIQWMEDGQSPELVNLEKSFTSNLKISLLQETIEVKIRGTIDRIDRKGAHLRIMDYKTGYVDNRQLNPGNWEKLFTDPNFSKAFQLLLYTWLYDRNQGSPDKLQAGVISLRAPGNGPVALIPPDKKELNRNLLDEFTAELQKLLAEILNNEMPFSQTTDENRCKYCTFQEICNRISLPDKY